MTNASYKFKWDDLGDLTVGRPNMGTRTHVMVYRLMQYTLREVIERHLSHDTTQDVFREAGFRAGESFCTHLLDCNQDFDGFVASLADKMVEYGIGLFRMEKADLETMNLVMTVSEDIDCSGLPVRSVAYCDYDEGFIAGILHVYTQKDFKVKEIDCWGTGERTCRFEARLS